MCTSTTYSSIGMDTVINTFRIGHIFEHDVAYLQGWLAEAEFEHFDDPYLHSA